MYSIWKIDMNHIFLFILFMFPFLGHGEVDDPVIDYPDKFTEESSPYYENDRICFEAQDCGVCETKDWDLWAFDNYIFVGYTGGRGLSYRHG